jgi:hypothetical protein
MKNRIAACLFLLWSSGLFAQTSYLYDDAKVASIYVSLPADTFALMLNSLVKTRYMPTEQVVFDDGTHRDTILQAGMRLRGNTSLFAQKKSFKISFNAFDPDGSYQGVRKLNLLGSHNDPTMTRQKVFYDIWEKAGMPPRRCNFVKLYINGEYRGLYTNMEEVDKRWLARHFAENDGNLYKCTYPADLAYLGDDQAVYKDIFNNPDARAYDLVTNESADDYSRFVLLLKTLDQPVNAAFRENISQILDVESVLKSFALDVATGNWDDYFYNKNNYYLYDDPSTGRFVFITYDTDNCLGVDWLNKDWAQRPALSWQKSNEPRPLATKLLQVPAFKTRYVQILDSVTRFITRPDSIFPLLDTYRDLLYAPAYADTYRGLDYGYTIGSFYGGFIETVDDHTPYGIKPFLTKRYAQTLSQIAGLVGTEAPKDARSALVFPNPAADKIFIKNTSSSSSYTNQKINIRDIRGHIVLQAELPTSGLSELDLTSCPSGLLYVEISDDTRHQVFKIMRLKGEN